jgi:two-component system cell cycle response regulator
MGARILIIEDNPANLELMSYLLVACGHTVVAAEGGLQGLELAVAELPDLIVCDVQLPDIDGYEVAYQLRRLADISATPLVAVTALAMVGDADRVMAAGFNGYLPKPIDPETFVRQLEIFLPPSLHSRQRYPPVARATPERGTTEQRFTILAVDSQPLNLELARSILLPSGYRVVTATDAYEGLARALEGCCDLIVADVCMCGQTGIDFLIAVRADSRLHHIPFVLVTSAMMDDRDRMRALALGADGFLRHPVEPEALLAEVGDLLQKGGC